MLHKVMVSISQQGKNEAFLKYSIAHKQVSKMVGFVDQ